MPSVSLLQQSFPEPKVQDVLEGNKMAEEALQHASLGIRVMPIPWRSLRISAVTDAAWGNAKDQPWLEDHPDDYWEETAHHARPTSQHDRESDRDRIGSIGSVRESIPQPLRYEVPTLSAAPIFLAQASLNPGSRG